VTLTGPSSSTTMNVDRQSIQSSIVLSLKSRWNMLFAVNTEECWQIEFFCIMTILDLIWQQQLLKQFKNWNYNYSLTQHTVQISSHLIIIQCGAMKFQEWFYSKHTCIHTCYWEGSPSMCYLWAATHLAQCCCHYRKLFWNSIVEELTVQLSHFCCQYPENSSL